jgi:hypothetical protein
MYTCVRYNRSSDGRGGKHSRNRWGATTVIYFLKIFFGIPVVKFIVPDWGDKVDCEIGLSYHRRFNLINTETDRC